MSDISVMTVVQGQWFDGKTSAHVPAELQVDSAGSSCVIYLADNTLLQTCNFIDIRVSSRIGNTPRYLYFSEGQKFETQDNAQIDELLEKLRPSLWSSLAHQLESHSYFVCVTLVMVIGLGWASMKYGLPAASKIIAYRLPQGVMNVASTETLELLDKTHLKPTKLDQEVQARVLQHFALALKENAPLHVRVVFRDGGELGANAFALPDGTIIFTDEMVNLAQDDNELLAVLAHEIGHVKYRHGLRSAIQSTSLGFIVSMLTGDLSAVSGALTTLPVILTTLSYSRDFEREADQNSLEYLDAHKIARHVFVDLMARVTYEAHCDLLLLVEQHALDKVKKDGKETKKSAEVTSAETTIDSTAEKTEITESPMNKTPLTEAPLTEEQMAVRKMQCDKLIAEHKSDKQVFTDYFSTHPATEERLQKFR